MTETMAHERLKVALGDLRHKVQGVSHSVYMPLGIGFIAAYALDRLGEDGLEIRLYADPNLMIEEITSWRPDVVGLSNFSWNSRLTDLVFSHAKNTAPDTLCVSGGPNLPFDAGEQRRFLLERPELDLFAYEEGEKPFVDLLRRFTNGGLIDELKAAGVPGFMSIHPETEDLVTGESLGREKDLDYIPSPYLSGLMDPFFDGRYAPMVETSRGCPYSCTFCVRGVEWYSRVANFSDERIEQELTYIAERIYKYHRIPLAIADSNFGQYKKDEKVAENLRRLQDKYNWPLSFMASTGKSQYSRILNISEILQKRLVIYPSVQSMHPQTLEAIKRKNMTLEQYSRFIEDDLSGGGSPAAEVIVPLPNETLESFKEGLNRLCDLGARIHPLTTMLLKGSVLTSRQQRDEFGMVGKYRIIPNSFGEYGEQKCFEIEEVCIQTNTMSFKDYLEARSYSLIMAALASPQFDAIQRFSDELGIERARFRSRFWDNFLKSSGKASVVLGEYEDQTSGELFESENEIVDFFSRDDNYRKLLNNDLGGNIFGTYLPALLVDCFEEISEMLCGIIMELRGNLFSEDDGVALSSLNEWSLAKKNVRLAIEPVDGRPNDIHLTLPFDVDEWYRNGGRGGDLKSFRRKSEYRMFWNSEMIDDHTKNIRALYGEKRFIWIRHLLIRWTIQEFWAQCERR